MSSPIGECQQFTTARERKGQKHVLSLVLSRSSSTVFLRSSHAEAIIEHPSCCYQNLRCPSPPPIQKTKTRTVALQHIYYHILREPPPNCLCRRDLELARICSRYQLQRVGQVHHLSRHRSCRLRFPLS